MSAAAAAGPRRVRTAATSLVVGLLTAASIFGGMVALAPTARAAAPASSAVTVTAAQQDPDAAHSPFPNLSVTVSQTTDLVSQGIRLTYSGGVQSTIFGQNSSNNGRNFLQVMECWGDLKDAQGNPILDQNGDRQPDRTTCQYGAVNIAQGQTRHTTLESADQADPQDVTDGFFHAGTSPLADPPMVSIPFRSVTGKTLAQVVNGNLIKDPTTGNPVNLESNEFYGPYSSNEVPWAGFGADGTGSISFEMQTAMQAPGLGCGNPVTATDGTITGQSCWLVIVPRGDHDLTAVGDSGSGLLGQIWRHRLAVPLGFKPLGVRCALGAAERQVQGSELASLALQSWQPVVCNQKGGSIYNDVVSSEQDAASKANNASSMAPLALVSRPFDGSLYGTTDALTYAPLAITGLAVVFAVDHNADISDAANPPPAEVQALNATPFTQMNLTPRLLAKLLTNSYRSSVPTTAAVPYLSKNPWNITTDPDFLAINQAWKYQNIADAPGLSDVFVPLGTSDSAWTVWNYVISDKDARDFLDGTADPWGMRVNPWATTSAEWDATVNPPGVANEYPSDRFVKPDPSEAEIIAGNPASTADAIAWRPYSLSFDQGGYWVLRGDQRYLSWSLGSAGGGSGVATFATGPRNSPGQQKVMGLTDTSSAAKYEVYAAALRNPAGQFVSPTTDALTAAATAMTPDAAQPQVVSFDPTSAQAKAATAAYPLAVPIYAATNPMGGDAGSRVATATLIRYAASGAGQTSGTDLGHLPPGYAPMPATWRVQALAAADTIAAGPAPEPTTTEAPTSGPPSGSAEASLPTDLLVPPDSQVPSGGPAAGAVPTGGAQTAAPSPTPTQPPPPVLGAATPADAGTSALGAAVPISAGGGLLAAAIVPLVGRRARRDP